MPDKKQKASTSYYVNIRDWKGSYDGVGKGWKMFAGEEDIETGGDCYATIFYKGKLEKNKTGQDIYDIYEKLLAGEEVEGYDNGVQIVDGEEYIDDSVIVKV